MALVVTVITDDREGPDGSTPQGTATFTLTGPILDSASGQGIGAGPVTAQYAAGRIAQPLVANDNATAEPPTTLYRVDLELPGAAVETFYVKVPAHPPGSRAVSDAVVAQGTTGLTSAGAAFTSGDVGAYVWSPLVPLGTTIVSVQSSTEATLSASASASGSGQALVIGASVSLGELDPV